MGAESLLLSLTIGAAGGALNAMVSDNRRLLPAVIRMPQHSPRKRLIRVGLGANVVVAALASGASFTTLAWFGCAPTLGAADRLVPIGLIAAFIGFIAARCVTNEVDKSMLHCATWSAAAAPAAHPDTVREIRTARPYDVYCVAEELMPRRALHPDES
jgi:hypothetical protein